MGSVNDILETIVTTPSSFLLLFACLVFFFVAVAGSVAGKIEPGKYGRIASGLIGSILLILSFSFDPSSTSQENHQSAADSAPIPQGSYQDTCRNTYTQGDDLYSTCKSKDGRYMPSALPDYEKCKEGINNIDGLLTCGS